MHLKRGPQEHPTFPLSLLSMRESSTFNDTMLQGSTTMPQCLIALYWSAWPVNRGSALPFERWLLHPRYLPPNSSIYTVKGTVLANLPHNIYKDEFDGAISGAEHIASAPRILITELSPAVSQCFFSQQYKSQ